MHAHNRMQALSTKVGESYHSHHALQQKVKVHCAVTPLLELYNNHTKIHCSAQQQLPMFKLPLSG